MKRLFPFLVALALLLVAAAPALAVDPVVQPVTPSQRTLVSVQGDVTLAAGEEAAAVVVVDANAVIYGTVEALVVVGGNVTTQGAVIGSLTVVDGTANLGAGTRIVGDLLRLDATVERAADVTIGGAVRPLAESLAGFALFIGLAAVLIWIGAAITLLLAALAMAALAAKQLRSAEAIISHEPVKAVLVGLSMIILPPLAIVLLAISLIGLPLALSLLFFIWPALAFIGYLVGAIWIGEWVLRQVGRPAGERPFLGALVGVVIAGFLGLIPLISAVVSIVGLGAVTVVAWRTLVGGGRRAPAMQRGAAPLPA